MDPWKACITLIIYFAFKVSCNKRFQPSNNSPEHARNKIHFISIQLNHKTNVKCGNLLFYFPFYCPSGKPRAKMKFNGHFDNLIIMAAAVKSPGYFWTLVKFTIDHEVVTSDHVLPPEVCDPVIQSPATRPFSPCSASALIASSWLLTSTGYHFSFKL